MTKQECMKELAVMQNWNFKWTTVETCSPLCL